jgi:hypothetical protein
LIDSVDFIDLICIALLYASALKKKSSKYAISNGIPVLVKGLCP